MEAEGQEEHYSYTNHYSPATNIPEWERWEGMFCPFIEGDRGFYIFILTFVFIISLVTATLQSGSVKTRT